MIHAKKKIQRKKVILSCIVIVLLLGLVCSGVFIRNYIMYSYQPYNEYGIKVKPGNGGLEVVDSNKSAIIIDIPQEINNTSIIRIGDNAFSKCKNLETITIPESVTSIGNMAFGGCQQLKGIVLPPNIADIGYGAFKGCSSLQVLNLPDEMCLIDFGAFSSCSALKELVIPDGITRIGVSTFSDCTSLTYVSIPESMANIDESAFDGCVKLTELYYCGSSEDWKNTNMFFQLGDIFNVRCSDNGYYKKR